MGVFPVTVRPLSAFALLFLCSLLRVDGFSFNFPKFNEDNMSQLNLSNDSYIIYDAIQITRDVRGASMANLSGRAFYYKPFTIRRDGVRGAFNTTFVLHIKAETVPGGEGLAFIMAADLSLPVNSDGKWLGIVNETTNGTQQASIVAVEFDTLKSFEEDLEDNHVGVNVNGIYSIKQAPLTSYGIELSTGKDVRATVRYDGENMSIFVSMANETGEKTEIPIFSLPLNLSVLPDEVFLGFSASTSNYTQLNCVKSWQFNGTDFGNKQANPRIWIYASVSAAAIVILLMSIGLFFYWKRQLTKHSAKELYKGIEDQIKCSSTAPRKFLLSELKTATGKFSQKNKLGKGGFGTVYRGILMNKEVAVKRISEHSLQGKQEFIAEITIIGSLNHKNLVRLIGWCYEKKDLLLVYEFMPNGSLDRFIYGEDEVAKEEPTLKWEKRYAVICGVAEALDYLHNKCEHRVLHRDIKASNIMLDSDFSAKLGDFGLARTIQEREQTHHSTRGIAGTPAYMAPESFLKGRATVETDVYAFGVFILEVVCGRKPGVPNRIDDYDYDKSIVHWLWGFHKREQILEAADKRLKGEFLEEQVERSMILGLACCHPNPQNRPSMNKVLQILAGEAAAPIVPTERPAFVWPPSPNSFREDSEESPSGGNNASQITELTGR